MSAAQANAPAILIVHEYSVIPALFPFYFHLLTFPWFAGLD
jgi:hypothetical protein